MHGNCKFTLAALLLAVAFLILGAAVPVRAAECEEGRPVAYQHFSAAGFGTQFGRGLTNIAFCWLEIPYGIKTHLSETCRDYTELEVFTATYKLVTGTVSGAVKSVMRAAGGAYEVVFSPFPPYNPINCPAWPPYLNLQAQPPVPKVVIGVSAPVPAPEVQ